MDKFRYRGTTFRRSPHFRGMGGYLWRIDTVNETQVKQFHTMQRDGEWTDGAVYCSAAPSSGIGPTSKWLWV